MRLLVLGLVAAIAVPARADDPVIRVRARMRIDVDAIERIANGVEVRGFLRDDASDEPIGGRTVAIGIEGDNGFYNYAEPAHGDGSFQFRAPLPLGTYRLRLAAGGDKDYVAAPPIERELDIDKRTPTLTLTVPERLSAAAHAIHILVEGREREACPTVADCPSLALDGAIGVISIGGHRRSDMVFREGRLESDELGPFGRPGQRIEVTAEVASDAIRNAASASRFVLLTTTTSLTLEASSGEIASDGRVVFTGLLRDERGPFAGGRVGIAIENGAELADGVSDGEGRFHVVVRGKSLPRGDAFIEARFHPSDDWREPSVSPTVALRVLAAPPVSSWPYVLSPLCTLLVAAIWWAARDRRWRRWIVKKARRRRAPIAAPAAGLTESRPTLLSSLRARADHGLTGVVVDAADDRAIATATVVARTAAGEARAAAVGADGTFAFEDLPAGPLVVEIMAPGYVAERFSRTLPHRGELRGTRVRLIPVRARIFAAWQRAAQPLHPAPRVADTMTPRELLAQVAARSLLPQEPLIELTHLVENAVWGARAPGDEELAAAERLASAVVENDPTRRS